MPEHDDQDRAGAAALARGGRTNFIGFVLRLGARLPFLILVARLYGAGDLGRFAYASMAVEFVAAIATIGLKRGIAAELAHPERSEAHTLADSLLLTLLLGILGGVVLVLVPGFMFPDGARPGERWFALIVPAIALSDVALAAVAFHHRIDLQVRARSLIEPWVLTIAGTALAFTTWKANGLLIAYVWALLAAVTASLWPAWRMFGWAHGWRPSMARLGAMARRNTPVAGADIVEWATRRLDVFILGRFVGADIIGIYFVAQQVATLAGKIRVSFDPILAPMLSMALKSGRPAKAAAHVRQVGFWVLAAQIPVVMALALPGEGVLGLFGPEFATGAAVLAFLLATELAAAVSGICEMGLIYARPHANLVVALAGLALQAVLSLLFIPYWGGAGAAAALFLAILLAGIGREFLLRRALAEPVDFWRPSLFAAAIPAFALGWAARGLPEMPQLLVSVPGVLLLFTVIIWRWGFGPEDRTLFARTARQAVHSDAG